ncbi:MULTISPECIES: sugar ABC transporter permease [unclassified Chelatococcus]|uniref:carbohydrate ABC transporter permease n=1 Tax=unclassified Chelatococcus TaxID=2638111 RepID=UPI001BCE24DC|nr:MULTISPECIES: sugar ABC transporter permease [unclassified Chelatococcus]CAH1658042.1 Sugar ABC transporter permease [Hyphomicrobiales bacterium]MBS7742225.1 sugar ABC transporter permease [Chelatococcus sp. HY11]MBX3542657.1 sugar ABC transporter permease [Chelatococcus sp.]MCO5075127.1 sugar ABC transporter permease [Chelatococcus sp.]CAH1689538.1 Sugar ABC transporter permease [Hyphomicrobiales bacterium]
MTDAIDSAPVALQGSARRRRRLDIRPAAFLAPFIVLLGVFTYWPLVDTVYLSFMKLNTNAPASFVGVNNFRGVLDNSQFHDAAINSLIYVFVSIPLKVLLPIPLAVFIWTIGERAANIYKSLLFLPTLLSFVVVSIVWIWLLNPVMGLFQSLIRPFGLQMPALLSDVGTAIYVIIGVGAWKLIGFNVLLYLAGLSSIGRDYIEAMRLDGAGDWTLLRRLIIPLLSPTIFFVLISTVVFTIQQVFTPIDVMTEGGPLNATTNLFYVVYQYMFQSFNVGYSAAGTVILFVFLGALTVFKVLVIEKRVHYS